MLSRKGLSQVFKVDRIYIKKMRDLENFGRTEIVKIVKNKGKESNI